MISKEPSFLVVIVYDDVCKIVLLDFAHHLNYKIKQRFGSWILLPSSGRKGQKRT
jgi:hypothetical protein